MAWPMPGMGYTPHSAVEGAADWGSRVVGGGGWSGCTLSRQISPGSTEDGEKVAQHN